MPFGNSFGEFGCLAQTSFKPNEENHEDTQTVDSLCRHSNQTGEASEAIYRQAASEEGQMTHHRDTILIPLPYAEDDTLSNPGESYEDFLAVRDALPLKSLPVETLLVIAQAEKCWLAWLARNALDEDQAYGVAGLARYEELRQKVREKAKAELARRAIQ